MSYMNKAVNTDSCDILAKYHARVVREAWLRAAVWGAAIGLLFGTLIMGASWLSTARPDLTEPLVKPFNGTWISVAAAIGAALLVTVLLYLCRFRPDEKQTARRLDALGLEERTVTMLSAQGGDSCITAMQRADTADVLQSVPPKKLTISVRKLALAAACIALVALCVVLIIPNAMGLYLPPEADEQAIIDELLDTLREDIDNAENVPDDVKETLHETVDELEERLDKADSAQEKMEMIEETSKEIHDIIEQLQTHYQLGEALMEHENTEELGEAVKEGDADASEAAMEKIRDQIEEAGKQSSEKMSDTLRDIASDINEALEKAGKEGDPLSEALEQLSEELQAAAEKSDKGEEQAASEQADSAVDKAEQEIGEALGQQKNEEQLGKDMQQAMDNANDKLSEADGKKKDGQETGGSGKDKQKGPPEDQPPKPGSADGEPVDTSDKTADMPIDDPYAFSFKDGETPYSSEYDEYFKREMAKLEDSGLSEEMKEMIARYYASIKTKTVE